MRKTALVFFISVLLAAGATWADDYTLTLKNHQFTPAELALPAGQKLTVTVINQDNTPAEFESSELGREKVVGANSQITVKLGPLDPGTYHFFDDFHRKTTTGTIVVK